MIAISRRNEMKNAKHEGKDNIRKTPVVPYVTFCWMVLRKKYKCFFKLHAVSRS